MAVLKPELAGACGVHRGRTQQFDYGLDKLEDLSSLLVSVLMFVCLIVIVVNAIMNICRPSHVYGAGIFVRSCSRWSTRWSTGGCS